MTVKCLTKTDQLIICNMFLCGTEINYLAEQFDRSRRTIIRVLEDANLDPGIRRRKSKPRKAPETVTPQATIDHSLLQVEMLAPAPLTWKGRIMSILQRDIRSFF